MPALPPDRPGAPPPAPGEPASGEPGAGDHAAGEPGETGPLGPRCPRQPARPWLPAGPRPLPDPAAVRLCLIPDSAPPYDADVTAAAPGSAAQDSAAQDSAAHGPASATGPADGQTPPDRAGSPDRAGPPDRAGSANKAGPPGSRKPSAPPGSRGLPGSPAPSPGWPGRFAQVLAETLAGSRSPRQLVPWTTERARERIQRLGPQLSAGQQPRVRRVMTCYPTADVIEMTVVVGFGARVHALAVRLERADGRPEAASWAIRPTRPGHAGQPGHASQPGRAGQPGRWLCVAVEAA
jgi:hypothetical protein